MTTLRITALEDQARYMRDKISRRASAEPADDYQRGMRDAEARALRCADVLTHSLTAPAKSSETYAVAWRVGFGNVRNMRHCEKLIGTDVARLTRHILAGVFADQRAGVVPASVTSFDELHDYIDANMYLLGESDEMDGLVMQSGYIELVNAATGAVSAILSGDFAEANQILGV